MKFLWRAPDGRIRSTHGEDAQQAGQQLGRVIGWDDDSTIVVMWKGKPSRFTLTDHGTGL